MWTNILETMLFCRTFIFILIFFSPPPLARSGTSFFVDFMIKSAKAIVAELRKLSLLLIELMAVELDG